jgi:hypothetical protein
MKKILFALLLVVTAFVYAKTNDNGTVDTDAWYYNFRIHYATPYGVPVLDADGNQVKDEKGSPVVKFEIKRANINYLLRIKFDKNGVGQLSVVKTKNKDGNGNYIIEWIPFGTLVYIPMEDGSVKGFMTYTATVIDRGIGVTPAICNGFATVKTFMEKDGRLIPTALEKGEVAGFSNGSDDGAWGLVENPLRLEPEHILSVYSSGNASFQKGPVQLTEKEILTFVKSGYYW